MMGMRMPETCVLTRSDSPQPDRPRQTKLLLPRPTINRRRLRQLISSWWWTWGCPKHVELCLSDRLWSWEIDASGWLIYLNIWWCTDLHTQNWLSQYSLLTI
jgi:hypothetical protein